MKNIKTNNAPQPIGPYSQAIISNGFLFTSGQIAINPNTNKIEKEDIENQTIQVMENLEAICKEAGTSLKKAIKTTCFLVNMKDFVTFNNVYEKYVGTPARSCVAVNELPKGALVEVEVIVKL